MKDVEGGSLYAFPVVVRHASLSPHSINEYQSIWSAPLPGAPLPNQAMSDRLLFHTVLVQHKLSKLLHVMQACNVCNGGSPLEITFRWMRWKKSQQANLLVPKLNLQNSPMQVKIIFCSHNSAKLCPMCRPLIAAGSSNLLISLPGRCRILKVCSGNLARWQSRRTNQGIETTQPTDFAKNLLRSQGTRHKRRLLPCFHAVQCQCSTECAEILAGRRILSGRK